MPKYELSHPELPQFGGTLELPEGVQPTARDLWEAVRSQYRPVGLSQLSDEAKLEAYQNGYFDDAPLQPGQPKPPSMTEGITDLFGKAFLSTFQPNSPYKKLMRIGKPSKFAWMFGWGPSKEAAKKLLPTESEGVEARQWRDEENPGNPRFEYQKQYAEAGKTLFGLLSTHEDEDKLDDPIGIAIRRAKMPHGFEKNEIARGKAYAAALDYATGNIEAASMEGVTRAMQGGPFVAAGAELLFDKLTLDEDDPDGPWKRAMTLDYVNSKIKFDEIMHKYENADELGAFILENPQESLKGAFAGIVGGLTPVLEREDLNEILIDKEDLTMESERMKDLQSGYMEPDQGVSFLSEITYDPMNLAGAGVAKFLTAPQRAALAGRIKKTLIETQALQRTHQAMSRAGPRRLALYQPNLESVAAQLAEKQKILDNYARNSLLHRAAGQSSPDELLKQAAKHLDTTTDVGRAVSGMVNDAAKTSTKMGALRKALTKGAYFAPEVAGATIGGAMLGPLGAVAGVAMPAIIKGLRVLSTYPESVALRFMMRAATEAGEELTEAEAKRRWRSISRYLGLTTFAGLGSYTVLSGEEGQDVLGELGKVGGTLLGIKFLPQLSKFATTAVRDLRAIGPELVFARTSKDSPFFNRLAQLPSPGEGLIGATRERFNTLTASTGDRLRDRLARPFEPFVTGGRLAKQAETPRPGHFRPSIDPETGLPSPIGSAPQLSDFSRKAARFLDAKAPILGRGIETLGRFGKTAAAGSSIPAAFGYLASGGELEGALAGALVSAPFTSVGAGFGMFENFRTKADLYQRKIGDLQYYREHLSKNEKVSFDTLPLDARLAMSGFSLSHPDIIFEGVPHGKVEGMGNYSPSERVIRYDQDTGAGIIEGVLAHEIGHHIAIHDLSPVINRIMFGNSETGEVGVYGKYDAEGKIVPNAEFLELKNFYIKRLLDTENVKPEDIELYTGEGGNRRIANEIFADHNVEYLLSGKRAKDNTWRSKIFDQAFEAMTGPGFLRDLLLKLNVPMDSRGKFLEAGFFKGKAKRIPALENLIKQYYRDTRGLRAREIEGEKVIDPASGKELKKLSKTGVRPIDDSFDQAFTVKDLEDPKLLQKLNTGGLFKYQVDKDGKPILDDDGNVKLELDLLGRPKKFTPGELKKRSKIQGDYAAKILEKYGVAIRYDKEGKPFSDDFSHLDSRAIDDLAKGPWHPKQIQALREISLALKEGDGERAGMLLGYFAASKNRKPGPVPFRIRTAVPYGFRLTKDGNILVVLHDVAQLQKNLEFLKGGHKKLPKEFRDEYQNLFEGDDNQVWKDFAQYRRNTAQGRDGQDGLSDSPDKANRKKNFLNALHGAIDKEHVQLNPILEGIDKITQGLPGSNKPRSPFGAATKTFRLDRIFSTERSGTQASPVNVTRAKRMLMPQMELDFSPPKQATEAKPNFWKIYRIDPKGPKVYDEVADVLIQEGSPWMDGSIAESQAGLLKLDQNKLLQAMDRAHRRWERGEGKQFMPHDFEDAGKPGYNPSDYHYDPYGQEFYKSDAPPKNPIEGLPHGWLLKDGTFIQSPDTHWNDLALWVKNNPEHRFSESFKPKSFKEFDKEAFRLGATKVKRDEGETMLTREGALPRHLKSILEEQGIMHERKILLDKSGDRPITDASYANWFRGLEVIYEPPPVSPTRKKFIPFDERGDDGPRWWERGEGKQFMPAAYHGTPHTFKAEEGAPLGKFKSAQIGTGEGAQAYGHGLYFAGNKEVAAYYREQLAPAITKNFKLGTMDIFKNEVPLDYSPDKLRRVYDNEAIPRASLVESLMIDEGTIRRAFLSDGEKGAKKAVKKVIEDFIDVYEGEAGYVKVGKKALKMPIKFEVSEPGSLYKVELAPKENEYLLWDKPLSEQPKGVREKIKQVYGGRELPGPYQSKISYPGTDSFIAQDMPSTPRQEAILTLLGEKGNKPNARKILRDDSSALKELENIDFDKISETPSGVVIGEQIYNDLKFNSTPVEASASLREAGIPGIKYLDGSSRSKGEGDYNYVLFDEADVAITEKMFMPADPKAPKRQPVNRVQPQAPSMPANRFMAPAASAVKGELGERFR